VNEKTEKKNWRRAWVVRNTVIKGTGKVHLPDNDSSSLFWQKCCKFFKKTSGLMLLRAITAAYCDNSTKHKYPVYSTCRLTEKF
jgi:hypothetical protein